jgi:hypothetical protein
MHWTRAEEVAARLLVFWRKQAPPPTSCPSP